MIKTHESLKRKDHLSSLDSYLLPYRGHFCEHPDIGGWPGGVPGRGQAPLSPSATPLPPLCHPSATLCHPPPSLPARQFSSGAPPAGTRSGGSTNAPTAVLVRPTLVCTASQSFHSPSRISLPAHPRNNGVDGRCRGFIRTTSAGQRGGWKWMMIRHY